MIQCSTIVTTLVQRVALLKCSVATPGFDVFCLRRLCNFNDILLIAPSLAYRALQKYMDEFHGDRDHAMCNFQIRSIPAVQLTQLRKLSNKNFQGTGVLKSSQSCQVLQCKVAAPQCRRLAEIVSFRGRCSRCLVLSPLPYPTLPK
jgi:hypothetical protein